MEVTCRIEECGIMIQRQYLAKHEEECRIVSCRFCEDLIKLSDIEVSISSKLQLQFCSVSTLYSVIVFIKYQLHLSKR